MKATKPGIWKRFKKKLKKIDDVLVRFCNTIHFLIYVYPNPKKYPNEPTKHIFKNYSLENPNKDISGRTVILMVDDDANPYGLSDRLQGAIFAYNCIKELSKEGIDVDFKINFTYPFELSQYLEPNTYDWKISPDQISYNSAQAEGIPFNYFGKKILRDQLNRSCLKRCIRNSSCQQIHVYTNRFDRRKELFSTSFNELFKPTARLQEALNPHLQALNAKGPYLNTTLRFQNLLGDFLEGDERKSLDNEEQKQDLIERCMAQIEKMHEANPDKMILVTSDSRTFLNMVNKKEYVYTIDGELVHMAYTTESLFETHQKAFVDYLMIAGAEKIYCLRTGKMYPSGFPYTASMINNRPFKRIEF